MKRETLADQVAADITDRILSGSLASGATLPTEPELEDEYGVSRSVIRDATRLLAARGLVEVHQGRGVFVTESQDRSFADALLLALRRDGATALDAFEFMEAFIPLIASLATAHATDEEIDALVDLEERLPRRISSASAESSLSKDDPRIKEIQKTHSDFFERLFAATHNKVLQRLASPVLALHRINMFDVGEDAGDITSADVEEIDRRFFDTMFECMRSRDPARAYSELVSFFQLPPEAVEIMRETPIGESPYIVLDSGKAELGKEEDSE
jgi:DNA-binding FadR family transcriptional regulator